MTNTAGRPPVGEVARICELISGVVATAAIGTAVRFGLFDAFGAGPIGADSLAARVGADADAVNRLLRTLASFGLVDKVAERVYEQNSASHLLCTDSVGSATDVCRLMWWSMDVWQQLGTAVRTGRPAIPYVRAKALHDYPAADAPGEAELFARVVSADSELTVGAAVDALRLTGVDTVADVGGGSGLLLREVLTRNPDLRGVLFDQELMLRRADPAFGAGGPLAGRVDFVQGDFRQAVPVKADLYLVKQVLHNWDDDTAVRILSNIAAHAPSGARIVVLDLLVDGGGPLDSVHAGMDLLMLLFLGGKERTEQEFAELFLRAGLDFHGVSLIADGQLAMIEGQVCRW